jgi:phosphoribosylaminoimidazole-succinocarboxamide synthase
MYDLGGELLLMVATDRISAFDVIMDDLIPGKGAILTALSTFWLDMTASIIPNHLVTADLRAFVESGSFPATTRDTLRAHLGDLQGRALVVRKAERIDAECVVRGYLSGSAWAEYRRNGTMAGVPLPGGMVESQRFPQPIFTPATKVESGHDENIPVARLRELVGSDLAGQLENASLAIYATAEQHASERGLILADTKFEFGLLNGDLILIDEVLTPDSSRFWPADQYAPGRSQPSFDKQYLRDYLESTGWNKEPPPPPLPPEVVRATAEKYQEALARLTGSKETTSA